MLDVYEVLFDYLKHLPISFFELGVYHGESLRYFREFFTHPQSKVVGLDRGGLQGGAKAGDNFEVFTGDQADLDILASINAKYGPFDIIMEDAAHSVEKCEATFRACWPYLKDGGLYIIEDMHIDQMGFLVDEITVEGKGKGFTSLQSRGFGPMAGSGGIIIMKKTTIPMVGLQI
jgi:cephalosporin hydroxylase